MRGLFQSRSATVAWWGVVCLTVAVGSIMIVRSSTVAFDGHRYFALFDDGMITLRYADNLVSGNGLVWNSGERVEGFSSPLWVFVLAAFVALFGRLRSVLALQILGLVLVLVDLLLVARITGRLLDGRKGRDAGALGAVLLTLTFYPLFYWSIMGMETGLLVPLLLLVVLLSLRREPSPRDRLVLAGALSLACLLRPESILFVGVFYPFEFARRRRAGVFAIRSLLPEAALFLAPLFGYQIFRLVYYGQWYANSYRLKLQGLSLAEELKSGWRFSEPFLLWTGCLALGVGLFLVWWVRRRRGTPEEARSDDGGPSVPVRRLAEFLVVFFAYVAYQLMVGGDAWPLYVRFPAPATVLLIVAFSVSVVLFLHRMPHGSLWAGSVLGVTFVLLMRWTASLYRADLFTLTPIYSSDAATGINAALAIRKLTSEDATVAAFAAGVIPYYAQRRAIDPLGKCDETIARLPVRRGAGWNQRGGMPGHNKYDLDYSLKQKRPTVIQWLEGPACTWGMQNLSDWCHENYDVIGVPGGRILVDRKSSSVRWERISRR